MFLVFDHATMSASLCAWPGLSRASPFLIQLADMIAYVVHKHYRRDPRFEGWFKSL